MIESMLFFVSFLIAFVAGYVIATVVNKEEFNYKTAITAGGVFAVVHILWHIISFVIGILLGVYIH